MHTRAKGKAGEDVAVEYLLANGFVVLSRNYQTRIGEIDCIAQDEGGVTVFVEVKAAQRGPKGRPLFWVTPAKQKTIVRVAKQYLVERSLERAPCRVDVVAVSPEGVEHRRNAFLAETRFS